MKDVRCEAGVRNGDVLQIIFHVGFQTNNRHLTIEATGDSDNPYRFFSNRELWEENAVKVIDATIYQNTGTITCAVVDSDEGPDIEIIVDNAVACVAHPWFRDSEDINIEQYSDVVEVEFWDVDCSQNNPQSRTCHWTIPIICPVFAQNNKTVTFLDKAGNLSLAG